MERIFISSDHVSLFLKAAVIDLLKQRGIEVEDLGPYTEKTVVDYPDYAQKVAKKVAASNGDRGIVICGTGVGASIAANKVRGIRAALCHDVFTAHQSRAHNDANVLAMGAWIVSPESMTEIVDEWLKTPFEGGRHIARVKVLDRFLPEATPQNINPFNPNVFKYAIALSVSKTVFGPVLYSGRVEEGFAALNEAGFRNVELSLRFADDLPFEVLQDLLERYHLKVTALATGQGCLHDKLCLSSTEPDTHQAAVKRLEDIIDLAHRLDAAVILGGVRGNFSGSEVDRVAQRAMVLEGVKRCCAYALPLGVTLLLEAINRYETNFINNAEEAVAFIDEVGASNLKVLLDTFHMNIEEVDLSTAFRLTGERLGYVHFVDSNRQAPGQGHTDLKSILTTLYNIGYRGGVSAEILPLIDDANAVLRTANYLDAIGVNMK